MCTCMMLSGTGTYFCRNMDLEDTFGERVVVLPRRFGFLFGGRHRVREHYAMIGMAAVMKGYPLFADAVNEQGLCMAGLHFPQYAVYGGGHCKGCYEIAPFELIPWVLSQCGSLAEARALLDKTSLANTPFCSDVPLTPLHFFVGDRSGALVVEPTKEGMMVYENPTRVLANNPPFEFHMFNVARYRHLSNDSPTARFLQKMPSITLGTGLGALGLPGDYSSASRFVKATFLREMTVLDGEEEENVATCFSALGALAPVKGIVLTEENAYHYTTYAACMNLARGIYYYKTHRSPAVFAADLHATPLDAEALCPYPLQKGGILCKQNLTQHA